MVGFSKQRKSSKMRGNREQGRGRKSGRGAGLRGGKGNAGHHKHKRVHYYSKLNQPFGWTNIGFKMPVEAQNPQLGVNVSELQIVLPQLVEAGEATQDGDTFTVDLAKLGVDKLLGSGQVRAKLNITVPATTEKAKAKVEAAGGSVTLAD